MTVTEIGRYIVKSELGRGGMAVVYLAHDPSVNRQVAIKVLPRQFTADPQFKNRFHKEAEIVAKLEHPAIVPVYDFGEHDDQPFIVMRYMSGGSLAERLEGGPLPLDEIARIYARLAPALDSAHAKGIVHRDLKPANILFDQYDEPYLADFGIVKLVESSETALTAAGGLVGTPAYMSPEQALGKADIDGRSDIYSLGAILFQASTGELPYQADTAMGLAIKHINEPVPKADLVRPDLPPGCGAVIARAMAKDSDDRYANARQMAQAIEAITTGAGQAAAEPTVAGAALAGTVIDRVPPRAAGTRQSERRRAADRSGTRAPAWAWIAGGIMLLIIVVGVFVGGGLLALAGDDRAAMPTTEPAIASGPTEPAAPTPEAAAPEATETQAPSPTSPQPTAPSTTAPSPTAPPPTITNTSTPVVTDIELGRTANGRPLLAYRIGSGPRRLVFVGAIHGNEPNSERVVEQLARRFRDEPDLVPSAYTLFFIPAFSPDGLAANDRYNDSGVDLNRNWDTPSWVQDSPEPGGIRPNSGGPIPFSEPETFAISNWLLALGDVGSGESIAMIIYHTHGGVPDEGTVQPGYINYGQPVSSSIELAQTLSQSAGYDYVPAWIGAYTPTGEAIQWSAIHGIAAVDVELPPDGRPGSRPPGDSRTILEAAFLSVIDLMEG